MKLKSIPQPAGLAPDAPRIKDPVLVTLDVPVFYVTERGLVPSLRGIVCARKFATTVLANLERQALQYGFGIAHVGVFYSRPARGRDGRTLVPKRWSNHAHGTAVDFKGYVQHPDSEDPEYYDLPALKRGAPAKYAELLRTTRHAMTSAGLRPEIVDEGGWLHLGFYV